MITTHTEQDGKPCNRCHQWKPIDEYYNHHANEDGKQCECIPCRKELNEIHRKPDDWGRKKFGREAWMALTKEERRCWRARYWGPTGITTPEVSPHCPLPPEFDEVVARHKSEIEGFNKPISKKHKDGYVYIISNKSWQGKIKIGYAYNPINRAAGLNTGNPDDDYIVEAMVYSLDARALERKVHQRFKKYRTKREWFVLDIDTAHEGIRHEAGI